jgi:uncharacterized protein (DUF58 family)
MKTAGHPDSTRSARPAPSLRDRIGDWIFRPRGAEPAPVVLSQRRVYIVPTRGGLLFALTLVLMLIGSINYNLSLGYGLTFLLAGTGIVSMLHTWRNLAHLELRPGKTEPVFAGDRARFSVLVGNPGRIARLSLAVQLPGSDATLVDVAAGAESEARIRLPALRRGLLRPGRFRIHTTYPLGLFHAWANVELDMSCMVYPAPETPLSPLPEPQVSGGEGAAIGKGEEDFAGLREYHTGDSPRRIAWKAVAHSETMVTKLFAGTVSPARLWLDYADTPARLGIEQRLSRLTRWVVEAHHGGLSYGLRLPGRTLEIASGEQQRARCLEALALFQLDVAG